MKLANHISNLLFDYDCVIVPGFGGFIGNYSPAKVDELRSRFHPPRKEISFNQQLTNNDGLLINHIAQTDQVTYEVAAGQVDQEVEQWLINLEGKAAVQLPEIGTIHVDHNDKWRFEPDLSVNFSREAFGLPVMTVAPVKKQVEVAPVVEAPEPVKQVPPVVAATQKQVAKVVAMPAPEEQEQVVENDRKLRKVLMYAAVLLPFFLYVGVIGTRIDVHNFQASDLNPFREKPCAKYQPRVATVTDAELALFGTSPDMELSDTEEFVKVTLTDKGENKVVVRLKEAIPAVRMSTNVVTSHSGSGMRFHVIGGCFADKDNANKLVNQLSHLGFDAHILDQRKGLWRVAFNSYATREKALQGLDRIRSNHEKGAWLLVK